MLKTTKLRGKIKKVLSRTHVHSLEQRARNAHDQSEQTLPGLPDKLNNTPYIPYFRCEVNTGKLLIFRSLQESYNLKTIKSNCNLTTDLDRAKVGHSSDVIFVSLAKLFNRNSKI